MEEVIKTGPVMYVPVAKTFPHSSKSHPEVEGSYIKSCKRPGWP